MGVENAINFDDLRLMAKRRLPKIAFDFIEGGIDSEEGLDWNVNAFSRQRIVPKYLVDATTPKVSTTVFGRTYNQPYGIAPTGAIGMFRVGGDAMLARAAKHANIPFIISGMSTATIEELASVAPEHCWYQLYMARDRKVADDMVARAKAAGITTLVVTVDVPGSGKRERNLRNGFQMVRTVKPTLAVKIEALRHPAWLWEYFNGPGLTASNWEKYTPGGAGGKAALDFVSTQMPTASTWDDIQRIRKNWDGNLVLKGVMHPEDAKQAAAYGVDGLMVSNHGGRQLDRSPAPLDVLPAIRDAVGDKMTVMFDSGIRRGADIVTAMALGAKFCFVGRWTLYGVAAGGQAGASHAVHMISDEVQKVMTQMGLPDIAKVGPDYLMWDDQQPGRNWRG
jgi:L-lactate dehydrogenase (cytochrome)/(S)-mandelate dehydrogenase